MSRKDLNQTAFSIVQQATGDTRKDVSGKTRSGLGRAQALTKEQRSDIAKKAALARWGAAKPLEALGANHPPVQKKKIIP